MKIVFSDTGYWLALLNPNDDLHDRAVDVSKALGRFRQVTTEMVLAEMLAGLSKKSVRDLAIRGVQAILTDPNVEVVPQTSLQFRSALAMYQNVPDKEWSLTDCASFDVMRSRGIREALAHDHHFVQAGFVALLQ